MALLKNPEALYAVAEEIGLTREEAKRLVDPAMADFMAEVIRVALALTGLWPDKKSGTS
jgi:hypothetical protein